MILKSAAIFIIQDPHYNTESDSAGLNSKPGYIKDLIAPDTYKSSLGESIMPNGTSNGNGRFCIRISQPFQTSCVLVYDMMGREMAGKEIRESRSWVELDHLSPGVCLFNPSFDQNFEQHQIILH